jgi:hypothetical protein
MSKFASLVSDAPVERELKFRGKTETVYFKPLTAGQQLELSKGQKMSQGKDGATFELDMGDHARRNYQMLQMTLCDEDGKRVFRNLQELQEEPRDLIQKLVELALEVQADQGDQETLGKG